jgi:hypothetical protein
MTGQPELSAIHPVALLPGVPGVEAGTRGSPPAKIVPRVLALGGSCSGEHEMGIGKAIVREGDKAVSASMNPMDLKRGVGTDGPCRASSPK